MTERFAGKTATVEWGGIKLRGTLKSIDLGKKKRTGVANGDGSVDSHGESGMAMMEFEASCVADGEVSELENLLDEPMLISSVGRTLSFPGMTFAEASAISEEGTCTIKAFGRPTTDG